MSAHLHAFHVFAVCWFVSLGLAAIPAVSAPGSVQRYDFQPTNGPVAPGFTPVTPTDAYTPQLGYGFTTAPATAVDGSRQTWQIFDRLVTVTQAIPAAVVSDSTRDCVTTRGARSFAFRTDVPPGDYDVTVWLGNITRPLFQVRAMVNGQVIDVERMDVLISRGRLDMTTLPDGVTPGLGNAVPRTVRVSAPDGRIDVSLGPGPNGTNAITWTYWLDESPSQPPQQRTDVIVPMDEQRPAVVLHGLGRAGRCRARVGAHPGAHAQLVARSL